MLSVSVSTSSAQLRARTGMLSQPQPGLRAPGQSSNSADVKDSIPQQTLDLHPQGAEPVLLEAAICLCDVSLDSGSRKGS